MKYALSLLFCFLFFIPLAISAETPGSTTLAPSLLGGVSAENVVDKGAGDADGENLGGEARDDYLDRKNGNENAFAEMGISVLNGGLGAVTEIQSGGGASSESGNCSASYYCSALNAGLHGDICPAECKFYDGACGICGPNPPTGGCVCTV